MLKGTAASLSVVYLGSVSAENWIDKRNKIIRYEVFKEGHKRKHKRSI